MAKRRRRSKKRKSSSTGCRCVIRNGRKYCFRKTRNGIRGCKKR